MHEKIIEPCTMPNTGIAPGVCSLYIHNRHKLCMRAEVDSRSRDRFYCIRGDPDSGAGRIARETADFINVNDPSATPLIFLL